jgi:hypothetical protein
MKYPKRPKMAKRKPSRVPLKLDPDTAWKAWYEYRHTDILVDSILERYDISIPTLYKMGRLFNDAYRRGRGGRLEYPLPKARMEKMWEDYAKGGLNLQGLEKKYGIGIQWLYKYANEFKDGARRRPDRVPRKLKKALTEKQEQRAWADYERQRLTVEEILSKYAIDRSTLYDIGDRLGSTFRRHKSAGGHAVTSRVRYLRNMQGLDEEP